MAVKKRVVYYLSGFDPRGVRHYHALYKEHSGKQSHINGIKSTVSPRKKVHNHLHQWEIDAIDGHETVHTTYRFLSWDDIIRAEWSSGMISYYKDLIYCIIAYIFNGLVFSFAKASPKQMLAAFYPVVYLVGSMAVSVYVFVLMHSWIGGWLSILLGTAAGIGILAGFERFGNQIGVFWLLRIYAFSVRWGKGEIRSIEDRINHFSDEIVKTLNEDNGADEILLISHSVGTILAVSVLARALEKTNNWDKFAMVTLGECIPLVSFQPNAVQYRHELQCIASQKNLLWLDYTAPIDGACFPLHDFMKSAGIHSVESQTFLLLSPRFHTLFDRINYKQLRRDWYTTHFLYLMSQDKAGEYDFFAMTTGAENIRTKFKRNENC
jgi:pimeloyl-ACP methyl ester carboxylesterase